MHATESSSQHAGTSGAPADLLTHLVQAFDWTDVPESLEALNARFEREALQCWSDFSEREAGGLARAGEVQELCAELTPAALRYSVSAPEFVRRFEHPKLAAADKLTFAGMVFALERARGATHVELAGSCWSAHGDVYFPEGKRDLDGYSTRFSPERAHVAPHCHGVALDLFCPFGGVVVPWGPPRRQCLPLDTVELSVRKLDDAMQCLERVAPHAYRFVRSFVRVISLRVDEIEAQSLGCSTVSNLPRHVGIANLHLPRVSSIQLANGILHEAIHCVLFLIDRFEPFLPGPELNDVLGVSPWTGRELALTNLVQATFVWYGLARFWERAERYAPRLDPEARSALDEALGGFGSDGFDALPALLRRHGFVELAHMFESIRERASRIESDFRLT